MSGSRLTLRLFSAITPNSSNVTVAIAMVTRRRVANSTSPPPRTPGGAWSCGSLP